jgi:hypothetical protein
MIHLLLTADDYGTVEFSDRKVSKSTGVPYQQVRTIHQKFLREKVVCNAQSNAATNAKQCFVTICDYDSYNVVNIFSNAVSNAVTNALKEVEITKEKENVSPQTPFQGEIENNKDEDNIKEEESNDSKKKEEELLTRLSELEKSFAELSEENRTLQEENEELRKKKEKKKAQESFDVRADLSYVDCFMDLWLEWLDYKDEIKKQYKTQRGAKSSFTEFKNLSHGNADKARAILDQSFKKSWDGLYDVKDWVEPEEKRDPTIPNMDKYEPDLPYDETMGAFLVPNKYPDLNEDWPYTPDNRPDGARICNGSNGWRCDAANKRWIEMLWIMGKKQWIDR